MHLGRILCLAVLAPCSWLAAEPLAHALPDWNPVQETPQPAPFATARALLAEGRLDEARASAEKELAAQPYDQRGYALLLDIADAADDDAARLHWGKWLYWSHKYAGRAKQATEVAARLANVYADWNMDEAVVQSWVNANKKAADAALGKKQYRLAGHLLSKQLDLNPTDKTLQREWDQLVDKAGQEATGGGFQAAEVRRKSASWIAKESAKHEDWETRFDEKSKYYDVETNLDYEFFMTAKSAMDEVYEFYQEVYGYSKKTPRVRLAIHRKRSDFDRFSQEVLGRAMPSDSVGGYWAAGLNTVAAYDRSYGHPDMTREDLWQTLFHESSHQFMTILTEKVERRGCFTPVWLDEGTATYFEGCQLKADGTIVKNNVAEHRLLEWWWLEHSDERHTLEELTGHVRNTGADETGLLSYEGDFYAYGWALVYFLLNYEENDRRVYGAPITPESGAIPEDYKVVRKAGRLVYREPYLKYLEFYSKEGNRLNEQKQPYDKAREIFVDLVADPDVPNWDAFESRWRKFTTALYGEMQTDYEFADVLQARCRGYLLAEDFERARITAEQADAKRPDDPETYRLLAESNWSEGRKGDAAYWMFRHWEMLWPTGEVEGLLAAENWLEEHAAKEIVSGVCMTSKAALVEATRVMEEALAAGHPVLASLTAAHLQRALGVEFEDLNRQAVEYAELSRQDLRMWQGAFNKGPEGDRKIQLSEGSRDVVTAVAYKPNGLLIYDPKGPDAPGYERCEEGSLAWLTPPYGVRGRIQVDGAQATVLLGLDRNGRPRSRLSFEYPAEDESAVGVWTLDQRTDAQVGIATIALGQVGGGTLDTMVQKGDCFDFELTMDAAGKFTLTVEGEDIPVQEKKMTAKRLTGGIALAVRDDTAALFSGIEVRPNKPFWPVAPAQE
jgi:hypothetical protein